MKTRIEKLACLSKSFLESAEHTLTEFKTTLDKNPAYAFEWSRGAFEAAAKHHVGSCINQRLTAPRSEKIKTDEDLVAALIRDITNCVMREARSPSRSTSVPSNEMAACKMAAFTEVLDKMSDRF